MKDITVTMSMEQYEKMKAIKTEYANYRIEHKKKIKILEYRTIELLDRLNINVFYTNSDEEIKRDLYSEIS